MEKSQNVEIKSAFTPVGTRFATQAQGSWTSKPSTINLQRVGQRARLQCMDNS